MFGNLIRNRQLKELMRSRVVEIIPFDEKDLSTVHYIIRIGKVLKKSVTGVLKTIHDFAENVNPYIMKKHECIIVESSAIIKLNDENIVGRFIPARNVIVDGLSLVAGTTDNKFGNTYIEIGEPEMTYFVLRNNTNTNFPLEKHYKIAHLELFDFRDVKQEKVKLEGGLSRIPKCYLNK
jgi:hypothetical protein